MLILSYLVRTLEIIAVWKNQIDISNTFFVTWVESTAKIYGQPLKGAKNLTNFIVEGISLAKSKIYGLAMYLPMSKIYANPHISWCYLCRYPTNQPTNTDAQMGRHAELSKIFLPAPLGGGSFLVQFYSEASLIGVIFPYQRCLALACW